ncbi:hypothetical protein CBR_g55021 [Chara braunii]|uniref:Uncharacterized protein n=1 Tax=Chara braunii TaxID=69332 RepID=A0A388MCP6_CHABU|nr:hypothetical protein CBR_g55021 [Chara braunii]|eukprot:GBG92252.1 hypothetical protein CBR_g55021 [Chara braunii]
MSILFVNADLMEATSEADLCEVFGSMEAIKKLEDARQGSLVLDRDPVEGAVVCAHAEFEGSAFLDEEATWTEGGGAWLNESFFKEFIQLSLHFFGLGNGRRVDMQECDRVPGQWYERHHNREVVRRAKLGKDVLELLEDRAKRGVERGGLVEFVRHKQVLGTLMIKDKTVIDRVRVVTSHVEKLVGSDGRLGGKVGKVGNVKGRVGGCGDAKEVLAFHMQELDGVEFLRTEGHRGKGVGDGVELNERGCKLAVGGGRYGGLTYRDVVKELWAGGGGTADGAEKATVLKGTGEEVGEGHGWLVGEGSCDVLSANPLEAGDEDIGADLLMGNVLVEGTDILDEAVGGAILEKPAKLVDVVVDCLLQAEGGGEEGGPLEEGEGRRRRDGGGMVVEVGVEEVVGPDVEGGGVVVNTMMAGACCSKVVVRLERAEIVVCMSVRDVWTVENIWRIGERSVAMPGPAHCSPASS